MLDKELNDMVTPLFDYNGPIQSLSDAAWRHQVKAMAGACDETKGAIVALIQRAEQKQEDEIERLREALEYIATYSIYGEETVSRLGRFAKEALDTIKTDTPPTTSKTAGDDGPNSQNPDINP